MPIKIPEIMPIKIPEITQKTFYECDGKTFETHEAAAKYRHDQRNERYADLIRQRDEVNRQINVYKDYALRNIQNSIDAAKTCSGKILLGLLHPIPTRSGSTNAIPGIGELSYPFDRHTLNMVRQYAVSRKTLVLQSNIHEYRKLRRKLNELNAQIRAFPTEI